MNEQETATTVTDAELKRAQDAIDQDEPVIYDVAGTPSGCDVCRDAPKPEGLRVRCKACGTEYGENAHVCHATRCNAKVPPKMLMCLKHWRMVPRDIQRRVWAAYVPGQEIRKDPTDEYMTVQCEAVEAVERREGLAPRTRNA